MQTNETVYNWEPARLKILMEKSDLSFEDAAKRTGISTGVLMQYYEGKEAPDLPALIKLSDCFEVSIDYLIGKINVMEHLGTIQLLDELIRQTDEMRETINSLLAQSEGKRQGHKTFREIETLVKYDQRITVRDYLGIDSFSDIPIIQLGLSARAENCLTRRAFSTDATLRNVLDMSLHSLLRIRNLGETSAMEILDTIRNVCAAEGTDPARQGTSSGKM